MKTIKIIKQPSFEMFRYIPHSGMIIFLRKKIFFLDSDWFVKANIQIKPHFDKCSML